MQIEQQEKRRQKHRRFLHVDAENVTKTHKRWSIRLHPLFFATGLVYCFTGELFSFLLSCVVALQHECAHAFAAAKLGYKLNAVVLMPYGASWNVPKLYTGGRYTGNTVMVCKDNLSGTF